MNKRIQGDCEHLMNIADTSNTGADMLVVGEEVPEYKRELRRQGYKAKSKSFGQMAILNVTKK